MTKKLKTIFLIAVIGVSGFLLYQNAGKMVEADMTPNLVIDPTNSAKLFIATPDPRTQENGLVLYIPFDGTAIQGLYATATDLSGYGNNGTITNGAFGTAGVIGQALSFDGVNDYVNCGSGASLDITSVMTISLWFKPTRQPTNDSNSMILVSKGHWSEGGYSFWYYYSESYGSMRFITHQAAGYTNIMRALPSSIVNSWTHFVVTFSGGVATLYLNGSQLGATATLSNADPVPTRAVLIGKNYLDAHYFSDGLIDEVRIYNRALSAEEVKEHYNLSRRLLKI